MAIFDIQSQISIDDVTGDLLTGPFDTLDITATIDDGENAGVGSTTFETGDADVNFGFLFQGTFELPLAGGGTELVPVFQEAGGGQSFLLFATQTLSAYNVPSTFNLADLQNGATFTVCFAAGSLIAVADGEVAIETLKTGDLIQTALGGVTKVKWIGRQRHLKLFSSERAQLVRIRKGALGDGLPHTDLTVTADHGMIIDGLVINASALVNGTTIDWVPTAELEDSFTVYHIETENHDVILANGAPSETFVDYTTRKNFDNYDEYLTLYGAERIIPEMPQPRISAARLLPAHIRRALEGDACHLETAKLIA